jgi:molybdopterin converting factor small subunit
VNSTDAPAHHSTGANASDLGPRIEQLIEALRQELFQYGEILALLDHQQQMVASYASEEVWGSMLRLQQQMAHLETVNKSRQSAWLDLARALGGPAEATVTELMGRLPEKYRLPVEALFEENAHLLARVRHCARHNHLLLGHVLQSLRQFLDGIERQPPAPPLETKGASQTSTSLSQSSWGAAV